MQYGPALLESVNHGTTATKIRFYSVSGCRRVRNGGWHFTSIGGAARVLEKMKAFAHAEYNTDERSETSFIEKQLAMRRGPFNDVRFHVISPSYSGLPLYLRENADKYAPLFAPVSSMTFGGFAQLCVDYLHVVFHDRILHGLFPWLLTIIGKVPGSRWVYNRLFRRHNQNMRSISVDDPRISR